MVGDDGLTVAYRDGKDKRPLRHTRQISDHLFDGWIDSTNGGERAFERNEGRVNASSNKLKGSRGRDLVRRGPENAG